MKLLLCKNCHTVASLHVDRETVCACGMSRGRYKQDGEHAWVSGPLVEALGFLNQSLGTAMRQHTARPERGPDGKGSRFEAFVIPRDSTKVEFRSGAWSDPESQAGDSFLRYTRYLGETGGGRPPRPME